MQEPNKLPQKLNIEAEVKEINWVLSPNSDKHIVRNIVPKILVSI